MEAKCAHMSYNLNHVLQVTKTRSNGGRGPFGGGARYGSKNTKASTRETLDVT